MTMVTLTTTFFAMTVGWRWSSSCKIRAKRPEATDVPAMVELSTPSLLFKGAGISKDSSFKAVTITNVVALFLNQLFRSGPHGGTMEHWYDNN